MYSIEDFLKVYKTASEHKMYHTTYYNQLKDIRLIINKFDKNTFKHSGFSDGDQIIDACCTQLLGVIPYDVDIQVAAMDGKQLAFDSMSKKIFSAICDRLQGKHTQMIVR